MDNMINLNTMTLRKVKQVIWSLQGKNLHFDSDSKKDEKEQQSKMAVFNASTWNSV